MSIRGTFSSRQDEQGRDADGKFASGGGKPSGVLHQPGGAREQAVKAMNEKYKASPPGRARTKAYNEELERILKET